MDSFSGLSDLWRRYISIVLRLWLACCAQCPVLSLQENCIQYFYTRVSIVFSGVLSCGTGWHLAANMFELTTSDFYVPLFFLTQLKALSWKSIKSTVCVQGYSKNVPLGHLCLNFTVARSRATQDAFVLAGVYLPLRTMTSNESFFGEGGDF